MPQQDIKVISMMKAAGVKKFYGKMREKKERIIYVSSVSQKDFFRLR